MEYWNITAVNTTFNSWVTSSITVSGFPVSTFVPGNVAIVLNLALFHTNPQDLILYLENPAGSGAIIGYLSAGSTESCPLYYSTTVEDSQVTQNVFEGNSSIPCPPQSLTAIGDHWMLAGNVTQRNLGNLPFSNAFAGNPVNGQWLLHILDTGPDNSGNLTSWTLGLIC